MLASIKSFVTILFDQSNVDYAIMRFKFSVPIEHLDALKVRRARWRQPMNMPPEPLAHLQDFFLPFDKVVHDGVLHLSPHKVITVLRDVATGLNITCRLDINTLTNGKPDTYVCQSNTSNIIGLRAQVSSLCEAFRALSRTEGATDVILRLTKRGPSKSQPCLTCELRCKTSEMDGEGVTHSVSTVLAAVDVPVSILTGQERTEAAVPSLPPDMNIIVDVPSDPARALSSVLGRVQAREKLVELTAQIASMEAEGHRENFVEIGVQGARMMVRTKFQQLPANASMMTQAQARGNQQQSEGGSAADANFPRCRVVNVSQKELRQAVRCLVAVKAEKISIGVSGTVVFLGGMVTSYTPTDRNAGPSEEPERKCFGGILMFLGARPVDYQDYFEEAEANVGGASANAGGRGQEDATGAEGYEQGYAQEGVSGGDWGQPGQDDGHYGEAEYG